MVENKIDLELIINFDMQFNCMSTFDLAKVLADNVVAQKRTGKNKQFVFFADKYVIKGPYQKKISERIVFRYGILKRWGTPYIIAPIDHLNCSSGIFLRFPNIMDGYNLDWEWHKESFSENRYKILKNSPVPDFGHSIFQNPWVYDHAENLITSLCHLYILSIGDIGIRSILIDPNKKQIYLIDIDENRGHDKDHECFYFSKPLAKKYQWYEQVKHIYKKVAHRLLSLLDEKNTIENGLAPRVKDTIDKLIRYSDDSISTLNNGFPKSENMGKMEWGGIWSSKTYSGYPLDIVKSALQKYIRRNIPEKAILSAIELYRLNEVGGQAGVTNLYNRLSIIANEDVGPANLPLVLGVTKYIEENDKKDVNKLVCIVQMLAESRKTRIMSHCWFAFVTERGRENSKKYGLRLDENFTDNDILYIQENKSSSALFSADDPDEIKPYILMFHRRLMEKDYNAFSWVYYFLMYTKQNNKLKITKRNVYMDGNYRTKTGKPDILLWKSLSKIIPPQTHDILVKAYYHHVENRVFLQHAIIIALYRVSFNEFCIDKYADKWENHPMLIDMLNGKYLLEIDDYVIDKHTSKGRSLGKNIKDFAIDGSIVIPQDPLFYNEILENIYKDR